MAEPNDHGLLAEAAQGAPDELERFILGAFLMGKSEIEMRLNDGRSIVLRPSDLLMVKLAEQYLREMESAATGQPAARIEPNVIVHNPVGSPSTLRFVVGPAR